MTQWNGRGLPPVAQERMRRFATGGVATSLLSVPAAATLESVGFRPVGEAMGCMVQRVGFAGYGGCGWSGGGWGGPTKVFPSRAGGFFGYAPYVSAITNGYRTALRRMLAEAQAMQADGVVGIRLAVERLAGDTQEFVALGTAVRGRTAVTHTPPARPFSTDLPGTEVAALLLSGWVPVSLEVAIEMAIRHDDYRTQVQAGSSLWGNGNVEVSGYTDLVQHTRGFARDKLARAVAGVGADGVVVSDMGLRIWEIEPGDGHRDHVAEATIIGTAIAAFERRRGAARAAPPLAMLPLHTKGHARR